MAYFLLFNVEGQSMKTIYKTKGFSLIELMIVIAIAGILAALAVPGWLAWRANAKINGAATNLRGDLEMAKMRAIKENGTVAMEFINSTSYRIFIDSGATSYTWEAGETILRNRQLVPGVSMTILSGFGVNANSLNSTGFNGRGRAGKAGTVAIVDGGGNQRQIVISPLGRVRLEY